MTRKHSHTCSGCAKPFTFRANNCCWCVKPLNISRQHPFLMREAVIHFAPTLFRLQKGTFRVISTFHKNSLLCFHENSSTFSTWSEWNILLSTISTSSEQFVYILHSQPQRNSPILGQPRIHLLHLLHQHLLSSTPSSELLRLRYSLFVKNVVKVNDHHLGLCLYSYSDISKYFTPNYTIVQINQFSNLYFIF